jgi:hypothetical protein
MLTRLVLRQETFSWVRSATLRIETSFTTNLTCFSNSLQGNNIYPTSPGSNRYLYFTNRNKLIAISVADLELFILVLFWASKRVS